jgi:hypothetical protein
MSMIQSFLYGTWILRPSPVLVFSKAPDRTLHRRMLADVAHSFMALPCARRACGHPYISGALQPLELNL